MSDSTIEVSEFYVAGGTLRASSPSYVERPGDEELFNLAQVGEFCYILTARQMGKSSLMVRTARRTSLLLRMPEDVSTRISTSAGGGPPSASSRGSGWTEARKYVCKRPVHASAAPSFR